ncbi:MAG: hypothetical protein AAGJ86_12830 [Pseudomonadota bacterium]
MRMLSWICLCQSGAIILLLLQLSQPIGPEPVQRVIAAQPIHSAANAISETDVQAWIRAAVQAVAIERPVRALSVRDGDAGDAPSVDALHDEVLAELQIMQAQAYASAADMEALQAKIARLPKPQRHNVMNALTQAMNDGRINGQLY